MALGLQDRDLELLKYIFENRITSSEQIKRRIFPHTSKSAVSRRLAKLVTAGYLSRQYLVKNEVSQLCFVPRAEIFEPIHRMWNFDLDNPHFKSESPVHDLMLGDLRFKFEALTTFAEFLPENVLESSSELKEDYKYRDLIRLHPDARLLLKGSDSRDYVFAIEFELTRKTSERYEEKLSRYYRADYLDGVFYICAHQSIMNALARADENVRKQDNSILYLAKQADVLSDTSSMIFKNPTEQSLELKYKLSNSEHLPVICPPTSSQGLDD